MLLHEIESLAYKSLSMGDRGNMWGMWEKGGGVTVGASHMMWERW